MIGKQNSGPSSRAASRGYATPVDQALQKEYAFELAASNIRYGEGVTQEVGMDFAVSISSPLIDCRTIPLNHPSPR